MTTTAFTGLRLVDGTGTDPVSDATIVVEGGIIRAVGGDVEIPAGSEVVDLQGMTVTPGLIDAHSHLGLSVDLAALSALQVSPTELAAAIFENLSTSLDAGFTTLRDTGGVDGGVVQATAKGLVRGPRVLAAGAIICELGGHGHLCSAWEPLSRWPDRDIPGLFNISFPVVGADEVRRAGRENFRRGASFLKLCVTGGVVSHHDKLTDTQFQVEEIRAAVEVASARGSYVTVHAHNNDGIRNAVEAGVKCVEHGTQIDPETARLMAANDVALVPTLTVVEAVLDNAAALGLTDEIRRRAEAVPDAMRRGILHAKEAGVLVGSGSDLIGPNQVDRGRELELRSKVTDPMEALVAATANNARILRIEDQVGTLEVGKLADLVAWTRDPLADPSTFNDHGAVALVAQSGQIVKDGRSS